jgi:hypothetical protein
MSVRTEIWPTNLSVVKSGGAQVRSHCTQIIPRRVWHATIVALVLLSAARVEAANHYIRAGGTASTSGTGSCTAWDTANVCNVLPTTLVRGDTYYIADGTYPSRNFTTAASGTMLITIKKATASDHGTDIGWSSAFGDGQATLGPVTFTTSYWTIDGIVGSRTTTSSAYGFRLDNRTACGNPYVGILLLPGDATHTTLTFKHIAFLNCTGDISSDAIKPSAQIGRWVNSIVADCLFDNFGGAINFNGASANDNILIERNYFINGHSSATFHGEQINANSADARNLIIRHNVFMDNVGTGTIVANNKNIVGAQIYGNLFIRDEVGNGIISGTSVGDLVNTVIYNNTFVNKVSGGGWVNGDGGTGNIAKNNLIFGMAASIGSGVTASFNAYFQTSGTPSGTDNQTSTANPFVNSAGGNYRLAVPTTAGDSAIGTTYNKDPDGVTRGADGTWDRGAFEYGPATTSLGAPTNLRIVP